MAQDWSFAWQVGAVGFTLVFIILIALYLALALTGWLSAKYRRTESKTNSKQTASIVQEKKAAQQS